MFNACVRLQQNRVPLLQQKHSNVFMNSDFYCKIHNKITKKKKLTGCAKGSDRYDWGEVEDSIKVILADGERGSRTGSAILQCHL